MSLFQRIKTPFAEVGDDDPDEPDRRAHAVGQMLRERRRDLGLDLDAAGEALRIKPIYLEALELGRAQDLPGPTYAIGFIRAYAQFLGLDGERVLDSYKAASADVHVRPDLSLPVPLVERSLPGGPILLVGLILAVCGYGTWYYLSTGERSRPERVAAVPADLRREALAANPSPAAASAGPIAEGPRLATGLASPDASPGREPADGATPPAANPAPALPATAPAQRAPGGDGGGAQSAAVPPEAAAAKSAGQIDIRATADCWIQVRAADDQSIVFSRVLRAGESYHVPRPGLLLRTGNAGALTIAVDGKPAPALGPVGALRRNVALDPAALLAGTAVHG